MKLEGIFANNIELTPSIEAHVMKRVLKLARIVQKQKPASIRVEVGKPSSQRRKGEDIFYVEFKAVIQDKHFRVRKDDVNIYKAIEKVRVDMHQQIIKWKKRGRSVQRKKGMLAKRMLRSGFDS
ncbi:hypothetical protein HOI18_04730 [Candidatus Uhrbacteria bacterium]|jgi:ribosomal subunit interface protein|nr:hypothetical protein [Candidatus Uhrbacteria bacterium]